MAVCPICGCKTEELDFVQRKLGERDYRVCSFCERQLKVFDADAVPTEAQIRWLDAVISKEVPEREDEIQSVLKAIRTKYPESEIQQSVAKLQRNVVTQKTNKLNSEDFEDENQVIADLQKRISALETEIRKMKRKQMIKTAVELGVPVIMLILLIIILLSSGVLDSFKAILDMAGYAF